MSEHESEKISTAKEAQAEEKIPDAAGAREAVKSRVRKAAGTIADGLIKEAMSGQLATAKYLFEVTGLYPATEGAEPQKNSLAYILLKRLGLPTEPLEDEIETEGEEDAAGAAADEEAGGCPTLRRIVAVPKRAPEQAEIMLEIEGHEC